jgi:hypothetical protein
MGMNGAVERQIILGCLWEEGLESLVLHDDGDQIGYIKG